MKEIKAYIRQSKADKVIHALEEAGVPGCTVVEVNAVGVAAIPEEKYLSINYLEEVSPVSKLEIICRDLDVERLVNVIRKESYSGRKGDGMIFVSEIVQAIKIRTGESDEQALIPGAESSGTTKKKR